jgi:hypothetical protein
MLLNAIIVGRNGILFVATHGYGIYRSPDNGNTWYASNFGLTNSTVYALFQSSNGTIFAGATDGMFASTDAGGTWQRVVSSQNGVFTVAENAAQTLFAGTAQQGVLVSTDNGSSWLQRNEGLPSLSVFCVTVDDAGYAYAGTASDSVYRTIQPTLSVDDSWGPLPYGFSLAQNFPNPFNPSTTISYSLSRESHVTLEVYGLLGQQVAQLVNGLKQAGEYEIQFEGMRLASGVYFYRIQTAQYTATRKMIILR